MTALEQTQKIELLAETYRKELGLKPWDEFEREMLERLDNDQYLTEEVRNSYKRAKRQCGKSTKAILFRLAEAVITNRPILVCGFNRFHTNILTTRARELADRLKLSTVVIDKSATQVVMLYESITEL